MLKIEVSTVDPGLLFVTIHLVVDGKHEFVAAKEVKASEVGEFVQRYTHLVAE